MVDSRMLLPIWQTRPGQWDYSHALHLLNRAGFGGTVAEINALADMGPQRAIAQLVRYKSIPNDAMRSMGFGELTGASSDVKGPLARNGQSPVLAQMAQTLDADQLKALQQIRQAAQGGRFQELKIWWLDRMVRTKRPLEEKMTLFWHGLFVTSNVSVKNAYALYQQNELLRANALGNYKALTLAISKDPAMLEYLNNDQNRKAHPNENYARELMELFTMGRDNGYTENDIKESARAFTGWDHVDNQFIFRPLQHDTDNKTFLGHTGNWDGTDIVNFIFQSPAPARYIAMRLVKFFGVDDDLPDDVIAAMAAVVKNNNFDIGPTLETLLSSDWFYSHDVMRRQIKSPVQLVVGALRQLKVSPPDARPIDNSLRLMGQELLSAPNVKGWDGGKAWVNTSTLFARYNLPAYLVTGRLPAGAKKAPATPDQRTQFSDFESGWNPQIDLADASVSTSDGLVDMYLKKLIGDPIAKRKRDDLVEFINGTGDAKTHAFDPVAPDAETRVRDLVHLIMALPEYQLC